MIYFVCGLVTMASVWAVLGGLRRRGLPSKRWHWLPVGIGFSLLAFTLAVIAAFLEEGAVRGALVVGSLMAVATTVWGVGSARVIMRSPHRAGAVPENPGRDADPADQTERGAGS